MNIIDMIKSGQNPQQLMLSLLAQHNDPMSANLMRLAQAGQTAEIERIARNLAAAKGLDYDKEFNAFLQMLGFK